MKNKLSAILVLFALVLAVAGCSLGGLTGGSDGDSGDSSSTTSEGKDSSDKSSSSSSSSGEKVLDSGIQECDDLAQYIEDNSEEIEGSLIGKGIVTFYKNYILKSIEEGVKDMSEEEKKKLGESCAKTLRQLKENAK